MKSHRKVLTLHLPGRTGFVNLTEEVAAAVRGSGVKEGLCLVDPMHITASIFHGGGSGLEADHLRWLERLTPFHPGCDPTAGGYLHNRTGEENGDAHLKPQVMGREVVVATTGDRLDFGTWSRSSTPSSMAGGTSGC